MRVYINDFELNSAANRVYLNEDIQGLELPKVRTSGGQRAGSHGSYIGKQLYDARRITFTGRIFSDNISQALEKRRLIQTALPLHPERVVLRVVDEDGTVYIMECQVIDFQMPIGRFRGQSAFKLDLEATDPIIYDDTAGGMLHAVIKKGAPGGLLYSPESPVFGYNYIFMGGESGSNVENQSGIAILPIVVFPGRVSNPRVVPLNVV